MWRLAFICIAVAFAPAVVAQHGYTRAEIENGARLYQASCATCHGPEGDQVRGVALLGGTFRRATTDDELVRIADVLTEAVTEAVDGSIVDGSTVAAAGSTG